MATAKSGKPYVWVTWVTKLLAGEQCLWKVWFKARYKYDKIEDSEFDKATWQAEHNALVQERVAELRRDGLIVTVENENAFTLEGAKMKVAGKPDIMASGKIEDEEIALIVDAKSGKERAADWWQVLFYIYVAAFKPQGWERITDHAVSGELYYKTKKAKKPVHARELSPARKKEIDDVLRALASPTPPERIPSKNECRFCDIPKSECPARMDKPKPATKVEGTVF